MWGLEIAGKEFEHQLKAAGLKLDMKNAVLITPEHAIKMRIGDKTDYYRRIMRDEINKAEAAKKAKLQAKQTTMFDLTEGIHENNTNDRRQLPRNSGH